MANLDNKIIDLNLFDDNATTRFNEDGSITGENISSTLRDMIVIPNWNIRDFAIERWKFKTQSSAGSTLSPYGEPGMFFYKVMFNFLKFFFTRLCGSYRHLFVYLPGIR